MKSVDVNNLEMKLHVLNGEVRQDFQWRRPITTSSSWFPGLKADLGAGRYRTTGSPGVVSVWKTRFGEAGRSLNVPLKKHWATPIID